MGDDKRRQYRRDEFLKEHPFCCYCGDVATTTDHCPPRSLFEQRHWPEGYEFPACGPCNDDGRQNELVIAALYRMSIAREDRYVGETKRLLKGLINNNPQIAAEWLSGTRNWQKQKLREGFGLRGDEMRRQGYGVALLGDRTHEAINYFGKKLGMALYYRHIERRLIGRLFCKSISLRSDELLKSSLKFAPGIPMLQRASKGLHDQFTYRYNFSPDVGIFYGVVGFREQLGYLLWAFQEDFYLKAVKEDPDFGRKLEEAFPQGWVCV